MKLIVYHTVRPHSSLSRAAPCRGAPEERSAQQRWLARAYLLHLCLMDHLPLKHRALRPPNALLREAAAFAEASVCALARLLSDDTYCGASAAAAVVGPGDAQRGQLADAFDVHLFLHVAGIVASGSAAVDGGVLKAWRAACERLGLAMQPAESLQAAVYDPARDTAVTCEEGSVGALLGDVPAAFQLQVAALAGKLPTRPPAASTFGIKGPLLPLPPAGVNDFIDHVRSECGATLGAGECASRHYFGLFSRHVIDAGITPQSCVSVAAFTLAYERRR